MYEIVDGGDGAASARILKFRDYEIHTGLGVLLHKGKRVPLGQRALEILVVIVEADGRTVSKDELIETVWSGVVVEENSLQVQVSSIRRALRSHRDLIVTEFGRGYRFSGDRRSVEPSSAAPPPRSTDNRVAVRHLAPLIGRAEELALAQRLAGTNRLLTIVGAAGVGKSRFLAELTATLATSSAPDIPTVDLHESHIDAEVATALTCGLETVLPDAFAEGGAILDGGRTYLAVDGCERRVETTAGALEARLAENPSLHVIATSRQPLGISGEQVLRLRALAVSGDAAANETDVAPAVDLFIDAIKRKDPWFEPHDAARHQIARICRALDGIPLAIGHAAACASSIGIDKLALWLSKPTGCRDLLAMKNPSPTLARHRSLHAAVEAGFVGLEEDERRVIRRLAVFAGSFSFDAAMQVTISEDRPWLFIQIFDGLVRKSLIEVDDQHPDRRYRLLEITRAYARECLAQAGEIEESTTRHARYVAERAAIGASDWRRLSAQDWSLRYGRDIDDLRAAVRWAAEMPQTRGLLRAILRRSLPFWTYFSLFSECQAWIAYALIESPDGAKCDESDEMLFNVALGLSLSWGRGPEEAVTAAWSKALTLARQLGDRETELQAYYGMWLQHMRSGRARQAYVCAMEFARLALQLDDAVAMTTSQRIIGTSHYFLGQHETAKSCLESAILDLAQRDGSLADLRFGIDQNVAAHAFQANVLWMLSFDDEAWAVARRGLEIGREAGHVSSICCALADGVCALAVAAGNLDAARAHATELVELAGDHGLEFWRGYGVAIQDRLSASQPGQEPSRDRDPQLTLPGQPAARATPPSYHQLIPVKAVSSLTPPERPLPGLEDATASGDTARLDLGDIVAPTAELLHRGDDTR